jgi:hypothetical protein
MRPAVAGWPPVANPAWDGVCAMALSEAEQKVLDEAAVFWAEQDPALAARLRGGD